MNITETSHLTESQKKELLQLWNAEYPASLVYASLKDFETYLNGLQDHKHFLLIDDDHIIQGWHFHFTRDGETWFGMIVSSKFQGQGLGSKLLNEGKKGINKLSGWVVDHADYSKTNGAPYLSPMAFYLKNDFEIVPDIRPTDGKFSGVKVVWNNEISTI